VALVVEGHLGEGESDGEGERVWESGVADVALPLDGRHSDATSGGWRNGSAFDSSPQWRSKGYRFKSGVPHILQARAALALEVLHYAARRSGALPAVRSLRAVYRAYCTQWSC